MIEAQAVSGAGVYAPEKMLEDLRQGIWSELQQRTAIDVYRRGLQRGYLEQLESLMTEEVTPPPAAARSFMGYTPVNVEQSDLRAYVRGELESLKRDVKKARPRTRDRLTQLHLEDVLVRIDNILNPPFKAEKQ